MQSLFDSTPMAFAAAYLAPAPSHGDTGWMPKVSQLRAAGWGIAPVYVGQQAVGGPGSHTLTAAQGTADAADAANLAQTAGLDAGSVVYLDVEIGGQLGPDFMSYISSWVLGMSAGSFRPGVYCSFSQTAAQITAAVGDIPVWVFHPTDVGTQYGRSLQRDAARPDHVRLWPRAHVAIQDEPQWPYHGDVDGQRRHEQELCSRWTSTQRSSQIRPTQRSRHRASIWPILHPGPPVTP